MFIALKGCRKPVYRFKGKEANFYYVPGFLVKVAVTKAAEFEATLKNPDTGLSNDARNLIIKSEISERKYLEISSQPFSPVCLTLYLNQTCPLDCIYCFSALGTIKEKKTLSEAAITAAIKLVAENCRISGLPLTIGFHGGGEPVVSWELIEKIQPIIRNIQNEMGLTVFRYLATNGYMSEERAHWLARSVDMVGLSCDGPQDIQVSQRPTKVNSPLDSSVCLERTAKILHEAGIPVQVRGTLTRQSFRRQREICDYIIRSLHPQTIHVEPVYSGGKITPDCSLDIEHVDDFTASYLDARAFASQNGCVWELSGTRLNSTHKAYCNVFRQVLQLVPGDIAVSCFKTVDQELSGNSDHKIGWYEPGLYKFVLDQVLITELRDSYTIPEKCADCFIRLQCTHNCPNGCPLHSNQGSDFLCELNRKIAFSELEKVMKEYENDRNPVVNIPVGRL